MSKMQVILLVDDQKYSFTRDDEVNKLRKELKEYKQRFSRANILSSAIFVAIISSLFTIGIMQ